MLHSGKKIPADTVLCSAGRPGMTDGLNLEAAGLTRTTAAGSRSTSSSARECRTSRGVQLPDARGVLQGSPLDATNKMRQITRMSN